MNESSNNQQIEIPEELFERIERRVKYTDFDSVSDYTTYVLNEVLLHVENENPLEDNSKVDEQQVRERLESLGYLKD